MNGEPTFRWWFPTVMRWLMGYAVVFGKAPPDGLVAWIIERSTKPPRIKEWEGTLL